MPWRSAGAGTFTAGESPFLNRELSWLDFNARVLALAADPTAPLLERVKFAAIFASNFDEFFEVRVAALRAQVAAGVNSRSTDGLRPAAQLSLIHSAAAQLADRHASLFRDVLVPELSHAGIDLVDWAALSDDDRDGLDLLFRDRVFPVLTPLAVDPGHPFPYISNLSLNLAVMMHDAESGLRRFARVKVPPLLPRFVGLPDGRRWLPIEELIAAHLGQLFPGVVIDACFAFRVTRDTDLDVDEEEAEDLLEAIETELRRRRFGRAVRLEIASAMPADMQFMLVDELELDADAVVRIDGPLDLTGLWTLVAIDRPDLKDEPWMPRTPAALHSTDGPLDFFEVIRSSDVLVHHPYDSFSASVEAFIEAAAADPDVLTIKLTLYRTSGNSPVVKALIDAAEAGKQVAALVELKARFDEQANIGWARKLERAGVHVVYGLVGLKTHTKVTLVVRNEGAVGLRRYVHIATGNYNSTTARIYDDLGLFSADPELGDDISRLFNALTGLGRMPSFERLVVAPTDLRPRIRELIANEHPTAERGPGRIRMKMNSLVDEEVINALYDASQAGVSIDLIIRGICCLRPGVPGLSENIRVRSVVGRFLEHSRVWEFGHGGANETTAWFIGSADMMPRNLDRRVEAVVPILDERLQTRLSGILDLLLTDNRLAWNLDSNGGWRKIEEDNGEAVDSQAVLCAQAIARSLAG
jgi:polyphosphate kinase